MESRPVAWKKIELLYYISFTIIIIAVQDVYMLCP